MTLAAILPSLLGGALNGAATAMLLLLDGRVAGISGILGGSLDARDGGWAWRAPFVAGLLVTGAVAHAIAPNALGACAPPGRGARPRLGSRHLSV